MKKKIAVLGATGSVGTQALDVIEHRGFSVDILSANRDSRKMEELVRRFSPRYAIMAEEAAAKDLLVRIKDTETKVLGGSSGICAAIAESDADVVLNSIIGEAGLMPSLAAIESKKRLALANKESLVIAGEIVMARAKECGAEIIPVDSEHSAIFQSLMAGRQSEIKKIILTASGGPFFGKTKEELSGVTLADTLAHPTWKMGRKITVDSATLMNKGFEIIEAAHLFSVPAEKIEVVVHRESILHSAVEYIDNTVIGEFSVPDMRMCIQYAIDYPERLPSHTEELDLFSVGSLSFQKPDAEAFPLLPLAKRAMARGGAMPAVLNAADEIAVEAFLEEKIPYARISEIVSETYEKKLAFEKARSIDEIIAADREARAYAKSII